MLELSQAIYNTFTASTTGALYTAVTGQLYKFEADKKTASAPYIVYSFVSDRKDDTFTEDFEDVLVQFTIISDSESSAEIEDIYGKLKDMYDWCELTITGKNFVFMKREVTRFFREMTDGYWQYDVIYRCSYENL